jgi:Wiskott-Aldrich syndrome protein
MNVTFGVQIKLQSVKLAMKYLKRVSSELEAIKGGPDEEELMLQGVRFAFRVHQVYIYSLRC